MPGSIEDPVPALGRETNINYPILESSFFLVWNSLCLFSLNCQRPLFTAHPLSYSFCNIPTSHYPPYIIMNISRNHIYQSHSLNQTPRKRCRKPAIMIALSLHDAYQYYILNFKYITMITTYLMCCVKNSCSNMESRLSIRI